MRRSTITRAVSAVLLAAAVGPLGVATANAQAATVVDDSTADFNLGTTSRTVVRDPGEVRLQPVLEETFDGTIPPPDWTFTAWTPGGAPTVAVAAGNLTVDGTRGDSHKIGGPGTVLDFRATFTAQSFQHVGFTTDFGDTSPWALISTNNQNGPNIYARTYDGTTPHDTLLTGITTGETHNYRIAWTATGFEYYVDGVLRVTDAVPLTAPMTAQVSDFANGGGALTAEFINLAPASGTFTSRVLDGGPGAVTGLSFAANADTPPGTSIGYETRTGDSTDTSDASWSAFEPVGTGGTVVSPKRRYLQYRATLRTTLATATPLLARVAVTFDVDNTAPTASITDLSVSGTSATATFTSDDAGATFECRVDSAPFESCTSPAQYSGLSGGTHTFSVRGTDTNGNRGAAVSREFQIPFIIKDGPGPGGGEPTPPAAPPVGGGTGVSPRDTSAPKLVITPKSVRLSKAGTVALKVKCPAGETRCKVTMRLKLKGKTVAKKSTTITGGKTVKVTLRLSKAARAKLAKGSSLKVTATGTATDAAGNAKTTTSTITLKPALARR